MGRKNITTRIFGQRKYYYSRSAILFSKHFLLLSNWNKQMPLLLLVKLHVPNRCAETAAVFVRRRVRDDVICYLCAYCT